MGDIACDDNERIIKPILGNEQPDMVTHCDYQL